jgi:Uncharacterized protein conserved in bacteria (DUF2252)
VTQPRNRSEAGCISRWTRRNSAKKNALRLEGSKPREVRPYGQPTWERWFDDQKAAHESELATHCKTHTTIDSGCTMRPLPPEELAREREKKRVNAKKRRDTLTPRRRVKELCSDGPAIPWVVSGYLGKGDDFDEAMGKFALAYADQAEQDHAALKAAVRAGIVDVELEQ